MNLQFDLCLDKGSEAHLFFSTVYDHQVCAVLSALLSAASPRLSRNGEHVAGAPELRPSRRAGFLCDTNQQEKWVDSTWRHRVHVPAPSLSLVTLTLSAQTLESFPLVGHLSEADLQLLSLLGQGGHFIVTGLEKLRQVGFDGGEFCSCTTDPLMVWNKEESCLSAN